LLFAFIIGNLSIKLIFLSIVFFLFLKFLFQWLPRKSDDSKIADKENELNNLQDEMKDELESLRKNYQRYSEIIKDNPDLAKSRIEKLNKPEINGINKKKFVVKRIKSIDKWILAILSIFGLFLGYYAHVFFNKNYNPLSEIDYYSPIIMISWIGLSFIFWGISFVQSISKIKNTYRFISILIFIMVFFWLLKMYSNFTSINTFKYAHYTSDFFDTSEAYYYKIMQPKALLDYDIENCDMINVTHHNDFLNIKANFQIWEQKTFNNNLAGNYTGFMQAQNYSSSNSIFCKNFISPNINYFMNKPLSISFFAGTNRHGKNYRFGFYLHGRLILFDSKKVYVYSELDQDSNYWIFLGDPVKGKTSYRPNEIFANEYSAGKAINFKKESSYTIHNWLKENNKIDIIFSQNAINIKVNDIIILSNSLKEDFWVSKELSSNLIFSVEKNSEFSIGTLQIAKLNAHTHNEFYKGKSIPIIEQIQNDHKAISISGFTTKNASISIKKIAIPLPYEQVSILNEIDDRYLVQLSHVVGYIEKNNITSIFSENNHSLSKSKLGKVLGNPSNLMSSPSIKSIIIKKLEKDDMVEVISILEEWYYINFDGQKGFMHKNLIEIRY
jgi:hypothetical protein